jgi:hypothetical protein
MARLLLLKAHSGPGNGNQRKVKEEKGNVCELHAVCFQEVKVCLN